jgi:hypothetical protein
MTEVNQDPNLIDINVSYGTWPFQQFPHGSLTELARHLRSQGIVQTFVSHLGGVFDPDAEPFNLSLIQAATEFNAAESDAEKLVVHPVPVINPVFPGWEDHLDECRSISAIRAVKIYPTYHNYSLATSEFIPPFLDYVERKGLRLLMVMRLEDERTRYHGLNVVGVPVDDVVVFGRQNPEIRFACLNAYLPEAKQIGAETGQVAFDTSFIDWMFPLEELLEHVELENVYFGSHSPFLYTKANVLKLMQSRLAEVDRSRIGSRNASAWLGV